MKMLVVILMFVSVLHAQEIDPMVHLQTALHVQEDDTEYAMELYSEVLDLSDDDSARYVAALNRGVLAMRGDEPDLSFAAESLRLAGRFATTQEQRRDAMFNLGHALNRGVDVSGQLMMDPEQIGKMISQLKSVERAFLNASRADPEHQESKRNVERTRKQIQQLEDLKEQIEQQQQEQQQQQGENEEQGGESQSMSDQLQDLADQQREQAQESESASQSQQPNQQERAEQQEKLSDQTQQANQQLEEQQQGDEQTEQDLQDAIEAQQQAQEAIERGDNETAAEKQQEAADALERAAQRMRESEQEQESEQQQGEQPGQPSEQVGEDGEPIDELAQQLLDKERDERERRQVYRATGRPVQVKEDW